MNGMSGNEGLIKNIKFDTSYDKFTDEFIAIEVSEDLLNNLRLARMGNIIGRDNDSTVLCTENNTYRLKNIGTSNNILVIDDQNGIHNFNNNILNNILNNNNLNNNIINNNFCNINSNNLNENNFNINKLNIDNLNKNNLTNNINMDNLNENNLNKDNLNHSKLNGDKFNNINNVSDSSVKLPNSKVIGIYNSMLVLEEIKPSIQKLIDILSVYSYKGPENEKNCIGKILSFEQLLEHMLCSKFELLDLLYKVDALCIGGMWRTIDEIYISNCVVNICNVVSEKRMDCKKVSIKIIKEELSNIFPKFIIEHTINACSKPVENQTGYYSLVEMSVVQYITMYILNVPKMMVLDQFYSTLQNLLPIGIQIKLEYLYGVALENKDQNYIRYFPKSGLKKDLDDRMIQLFEFNQKWLKEQIEPYILDALDESDNLERVFLKYCNKFVDENNKVFILKKTNKSFSLS